MPGGFYVSKIGFAREAMPPLQRLTLGKLLRQFFLLPQKLCKERLRLTTDEYLGGEAREPFLPLGRLSLS